jgi:hypothetical protein
MSPRALRLASLAAALTLAACGAETEPPEPDASVEPADDAGTPDAGAGGDDAGVTPGPDAGTDDAGAPLAGVLVYPLDRAHSPLTAEVAAHLKAIAALKPSRAGNVFSKVGDSNTVNFNHLTCFAGAQVDLAFRPALEPALAHFRGGSVDGGSPFARTSLAATVGWSAFSALAGSPSPLQQEVDTANPRYASVMFGTNDVGFADPYTYGQNLFTIVDTLSLQGVVPIVSSVPPRDDNATANAWAQRYNLVARGVAQARQVPFVDLHRELLPMPNHGLGGDGVHLNVYTPSGARGCVLTSAGLAYGHNRRNLLTLEALSRAWGAVEGQPVPDASGPRRLASGTQADPVLIDALPFVDARDTRTDGEARLGSYPGCMSAANEGGREVLYRLELAQPATVRAFVVALGGADIDVHLLSSSASGQACVARNDKVIVKALGAGTHWLALDTYVASGNTLAGEYVVVVTAE